MGSPLPPLAEGAAASSGTAGFAAAEGAAVSSGTAEFATPSPDGIDTVADFPDLEVTAEDEWTRASVEVDAFLKAVGPLVRDALLEVFQDVLEPKMIRRPALFCSKLRVAPRPSRPSAA